MLNKQPNNKARIAAFSNLNVPHGNSTMLCLDGGGMKGILTIQLLKKIESVARIPCYRFFNLIAGSSSGGIIAALIANGFTANEIEKIYDELIHQVFKKRIAGSRFLNPPQFSKSNFRRIAKSIFGNQTIGDICNKNNTDLIITAKDLTGGEETFFTCFRKNGQTYTGNYSKVLMRAALEATMSAPTYFTPLERFVDGGTTCHNNPSMAVILKALNDSESGQYAPDRISVFSFGTGATVQFITAEEAQNPNGLDVTFWLNWLMTETSNDASSIQTEMLRSSFLKKQIDYRRFQISLDERALKLIPDCKIDSKYGKVWLHELDNKFLRQIDMSDVDKYDLMKVIGRQMAEYIMQCENKFGSDLIDSVTKRDKLVTAFGDSNKIKLNMSDASWLDKQKK